MKEVGFVGALVKNHFEGRFCNDETFWPVIEMAEELGTVLYIHPTFPSGDRELLYKGSYVLTVEKSLGSAGFGWHMETGPYILKLFAAGVFDKYLKFKIVIGHMGEVLPSNSSELRNLRGEGRLERGRGD